MFLRFLVSLFHECCCWFFYQAEDGIRDLVRSRGRGDVYKRQDPDEAECADDHEGSPPSQPVGERRHDQRCEDGTDRGARVEDAVAKAAVGRGKPKCLSLIHI